MPSNEELVTSNDKSTMFLRRFLQMKIFGILILLMALTIISGSAQAPFPLEAGVSQTLAKWRAANYSDVRYKLNLTLEKGAPVLKGTIEIKLSVAPASAGASNSIILDWRKIRGKEDFSKISNVSVNGSELRLQPRENIASKDATLSYEEINEHLIFKEGVVSGENVIKLDFTSPIATSGAAVTRYVDREDGAEYIYSLFVPSDASTAFPVFDQPDLKARFQLNVLAPREWTVVSNSEMGEFRVKNLLNKPGSYEDKQEIDQINSWARFLETKPISTYVFAFAAGDFVKVSEPGAVATGLLELSIEPVATAPGSDIYVRKSQVDKFKQHFAEVFRLNREGIKYLESYFDFKFPFPKYDLVLIPEFPFRGMEHAGATFLREDSIIFPSEPTANDHISRANVIFHEAAHQWFGDTVTMKWFDDLWLKEGFAEFMAYKTLEKVMPEYNAWKAFYERNKPLAYATDSTRGTTPIYQEIPNLSAAKSAYGNIVYRKAPSFLRQAEFYLGEKEFQTAVRAFLKKHEFKNAEWTDLVKDFEAASGQNLKDWANVWVKKRGLPIFRMKVDNFKPRSNIVQIPIDIKLIFSQSNSLGENSMWMEKLQFLYLYENGKQRIETITLKKGDKEIEELWGVNFRGQESDEAKKELRPPKFIFTNYQDYGYGVFLLDEKSREYVLKNIQNEKDDFLRSMMWGALWDSVREAELSPKTYVELAIKNISVEKDELTIQTILARVSTAMNYYLSDAQAKELAPKLEDILIEKMQKAPTLGQRITFYRAFLNVASSEKARQTLKDVLNGKFEIKGLKLKTKDKFDIVTKLAMLGDADAPKLLDELIKTETSDEAKRYAYAVAAGFGTKEAKEKYFNDFVNNKEISESWIESAFVPFNSVRHAELTLPFLERALAELPNLKRNRKIFFVNGWLASFIGGHKDEKALGKVNKFLADNPNLDKDLRLKILENLDVIERAVKIRAKYSK